MSDVGSGGQVGRGLSRETKNLWLGLVAALYFALLLWRGVLGSPPGRDALWCIAAVVVGLLHLPWIAHRVAGPLRHASLFLIVGAAIGFTGADAIKDPSSMHWLDWGWLASAVAAAVVHYSPSDRDVYR